MHRLAQAGAQLGDLLGQTVEIKITKTSPWSLQGTLV
ncbi:MAG: TRAM domain-containing protein [Rhodospirillaceae bacterium]|nr:TRAM domain-containing protein [Rhodospirillaceae bacterium]